MYYNKVYFIKSSNNVKIYFKKKFTFFYVLITIVVNKRIESKTLFLSYFAYVFLISLFKDSIEELVVENPAGLLYNCHLLNCEHNHCW